MTKSLITLRDEDSFHKHLCLFCGKIFTIATGSHLSAGPCVCEKAIELSKITDYKVAQQFIQENTKWYIVRSGKHGQVITSNKEEYTVLVTLKRIRAEENLRKEKEREEERRIQMEEWQRKSAEEAARRKIIEAKRLEKSNQFLSGSTLKELIEGLIEIADANMGYDEIDTDYKEYVTYEELKTYIQENYEKLLNKEIARLQHEADMDE